MSDESAFPMAGFQKTERTPDGTVVLNIPHSNGLTKRELFAAFAMLGHFIINANVSQDASSADDFAKGSVVMADALLAELAKERK